jgi:hypothetical protein
MRKWGMGMESFIPVCHGRRAIVGFSNVPRKEKQKTVTPYAPTLAQDGLYEQGYGPRLVFTAGQIALDPKTGALALSIASKRAGAGKSLGGFAGYGASLDSVEGPYF